MPIIRFSCQGRSTTVEVGTSLLDAATQAGVTIDAPCGGEGVCGECRVRVERGELEHVPRGCLLPEELTDGWVLACGSRLTSDVTVHVPERAAHGPALLTAPLQSRLAAVHGDAEQTGIGIQATEPLAVKLLLQVDPPLPENSFSDFDRLASAIRRAGGGESVTADLGVLRELAGVLRDDRPLGQEPAASQAGDYHSVTATIVTADKTAPVEIIRIESGDTTDRQVGLAIDVGTTTCAVSLVDLVSNHILGTTAGYNGQLSRGEDIISRINYAKTPERIEELRRLVLDTMNGLITGLCDNHGIGAEQIDNAAVAGNTTMIHLLLGLTPEYIRLAPYTPTVNHPPRLRAGEVGLAMNPRAYVVFAPGVASYVGGDITAGLLQTALAAESDDVRLFLDIGTNGEVVVGTGEWLMTCAASAGPAFEGSGVSCGMRACPGAIERVRIDPDSGRAHVSVIGGEKPQGVCGSGIIDLLAQLWNVGLLDQSGKLDARVGSTFQSVDKQTPDPDPGGDGMKGTAESLASLHASGRDLAYTIVPESDSGTGKTITIDERDIQNLLRTKAAVYSACAILLKSVGLDFDAITEVYVAGGFGRFLDLKASITIGLLPDLPLERFTYLGNAALTGARAMLCDSVARKRAGEIAGRMTYVELNADPAYMSEYTAALFLPHTDIDRFPRVKAALASRHDK